MPRLAYHSLSNNANNSSKYAQNKLCDDDPKGIDLINSGSKLSCIFTLLYFNQKRDRHIGQVAWPLVLNHR